MQKWIKYVNTEAGKQLLSFLTDKKRIEGDIVGLTPNSYHIEKEKELYEAHFFCKESVLTLLAPIFDRMDISNEFGYDAFLHHSDLYKSKKFSTVYLETSTFNTGAGDGSMRYHDGTSSWADIRAQTTATNVYNTDATSKGAGSENTDRLYLYRSFLPYVTSSLDDPADIQTTGTKLRVHVTASGDSGGTSIGLIQTTQASTSALADTDYDNLTVNSPTEGATRVAISTITTSAYNEWAANANLVSWISKTGNTLLGLRNSDDIDNSAPGAGESNFITHTNSEAGSNLPELVVVYSLSFLDLTSKIW